MQKLDKKYSSAAIIGSGFSSISAACYLAKAGFEVDVYEKNDQLGGRARQLVIDDFKFDMGPSWYWMPDVFERFFADFGKKPADYYDLKRLSPGYRVYFGHKDYVDIDAATDKIIETFDAIEPGAGRKLERFIKKAAKNYKIAIEDLVYRPGLNISELVTPNTVTEIKQFIFSIRHYVSRNFKNPRLRQILEFPVLFLGAKPSDTPLFYSFMNYADFGLGTFYPKGGMRTVVEGMITLAKSLGVRFHINADIRSIKIGRDNTVQSMEVNNTLVETNLLVSGADYHHTEQLLPIDYRSYSEKYWQSRVMAPSSVLFYVGFDKPINNVLHHTLFFDEPFDQHAEDIYVKPRWPEKPLFYASFSSKTDETVAPKGKEAAVFLIPLATGLNDCEAIRKAYFEKIMCRLEKMTGEKLREHVLFTKSYAINDFVKDYNAFGGNAYGLANTLKQTAFLRPKLQSKKLNNLYFTGQLTVPGPGVPPAIISGKLVSDLITKRYTYERAV